MINNIQVSLTKEQYNGLVFLHRVTGKVLAQAAPTDESPYAVTGMELIQIVGEELTSGGQG